MSPRRARSWPSLPTPLLDALRRAPDPDAALIGFSRYVATRYPKAMFLRYLIDDPRALGLLIEVLGTSPFLSEILIRNPEYLHWLVSQVDRSPPDAADLLEEIDELIDRVQDEAGHLDALKRFKRRELLRIAARDILGRETLESVTEQLSDLADVITSRGAAYRGAQRPCQRRPRSTPWNVCRSGHGEAGRPRAELQLRHRSHLRVRARR